jgi:hypothetical protein
MTITRFLSTSERSGLQCVQYINDTHKVGMAAHRLAKAHVGQGGVRRLTRGKSDACGQNICNLILRQVTAYAACPTSVDRNVNEECAHSTHLDVNIQVLLEPELIFLDHLILED